MNKNNNNKNNTNVNNNFYFYNNPSELKSFLTLKNTFSDYKDNQFIVFSCLNNKSYLIYINEDKVSLNCCNLLSFEIKEFKNLHLKLIQCIKYYRNKNKDIIITSSKDNNVKIFYFDDGNLNCITQIKNVGDNDDYNENFWIYSLLMITINNYNYIITSNFWDSYLKIYDLKGNLIENNFCKHNDKSHTFYINHYYNKKTNKHFFIKNNGHPSSVKAYTQNSKEFNTYNKVFAYNNIIYENNNITYLIFSNRFTVYIYDFFKADLLNAIAIGGENELLCTLLWNEKYIISGSSNTNLYIINIKNGQLIKTYNNCHNNDIYSLDKIRCDNKFYLFTQDLDGDIKIWK
jgi:WD40 repeat protein